MEDHPLLRMATRYSKSYALKKTGYRFKRLEIRLPDGSSGILKVSTIDDSPFENEEKYHFFCSDADVPECEFKTYFQKHLRTINGQFQKKPVKYETAVGHIEKTFHKHIHRYLAQLQEQEEVQEQNPFDEITGVQESLGDPFASPEEKSLSKALPVSAPEEKTTISQENFETEVLESWDAELNQDRESMDAPPAPDAAPPSPPEMSQVKESSEKATPLLMEILENQRRMEIEIQESRLAILEVRETLATILNHYRSRSAEYGLATSEVRSDSSLEAVLEIYEKEVGWKNMEESDGLAEATLELDNISDTQIIFVEGLTSQIRDGQDKEINAMVDISSQVDTDRDEKIRTIMDASLRTFNTQDKNLNIITDIPSVPEDALSDLEIDEMMEEAMTSDLTDLDEEPAEDVRSETASPSSNDGSNRPYLLRHADKPKHALALTTTKNTAIEIYPNYEIPLEEVRFVKFKQFDIPFDINEPNYKNGGYMSEGRIGIGLRKIHAFLISKAPIASELNQAGELVCQILSCHDNPLKPTSS